MLEDRCGDDRRVGLIASRKRCLCRGYGVFCLIACQQTVKAAGVDLPGFEILVVKDSAEEAEIAPNSADDIFLQRSQHTLDCSVSSGGVCDQLRKKGIIFNRDDAALVDATILANSRTRRLQQPA